MSALPANAATGFSWLRAQEADRRQTASGWQAGVLFQSTAPHRLWPHHATVSGYHSEIYALRKPASGGIRIHPDFGHERAASVLAIHRQRRCAACLAMVEPIGCAVELLPQFVASTVVSPRQHIRCCEPPGAIRLIGIDVPVAIATVWATALCALPGTNTAAASVISLLAVGSFPHAISLTPVVDHHAKPLILSTLSAQQISSLDDFRRHGYPWPSF